MLSGSFTVKVDEKGRVKVPSEFRRRIEQRYGDGPFFVTSVRGDCAHLYPEKAWDEILQKLSTQPPSRPIVAKFRLATDYYGQPASIDAQGRLLIHPRLRHDAGIEDEVVIVAHPNRLEVWNHRKIKEELEKNPLTGEEMDQLTSLLNF